MGISRVVLNEMAFFGKGSVNVILSEMEKRGFENAFIVTDKVLIKCGVVDHVTHELDGAKIKYEIFDDIKPNPTVDNVKSGIKKFKEGKWACIIAIGGGSVIDTAKAIGIIANNPEFEDVRSLEGAAQTKYRSVPIIAIPTTAGTAAEVTINYVITDEENKKKFVCVDANDIPVLSIIDSDLMKSMPKKLAAATGLDALTHAIEGYITKGAWELSDALSLRAIRLIAKNLEDAVEGKDEAIEMMGLAQYMAGMAFSNVGLGLVHGMAHPLGARFNTPHGDANALLLPYVMEYNADACAKKFKYIAHAMGVNVSNMTEEEWCKSAVDAVKNLAKKVGTPTSLREIGVPEEKLYELAQDASEDICTPGNPKPVTKEEIYEIYKKAY